MIAIPLALIIVGIAWFFLKPYVAEPFSTMALVVLILLFVIWLLGMVGGIPTTLR